MHRNIRFLAMLVIALFMFACHRGGSEDVISAPYTPTPVASSPTKVRVVEVTNDTHQVFDVDVIGLLWTGLDSALKKRGMLWAPEMGGNPITIEAHVVAYKKGSMVGRLVPYAGDTLLAVRCDVRDGDKQIATIESKRKIAFGGGTFTRGAWSKVFDEVSEEVISQAARKF
jgi:hypothetical protein